MKGLFSSCVLLLLAGCSATTLQTRPQARTDAETTMDVRIDVQTPNPDLAHEAPSERNVTLVLGDSHMVGEYGDALVQRIETKSDLLMIANCGAGTYTFVATPIKRPCGKAKYKNVVVRRAPESLASQLVDPMASLAATVQELNPNIVVIGLGTNYDNLSPGSIKKLTEILVQNAPALSKLIWIGPPYFVKKGGDSIPVVNTIRTALGLADAQRARYETEGGAIDVIFADSTNFNKERHPLNIPKGDFHFYGKRTREWAEYTWAMIDDEF